MSAEPQGARGSRCWRFAALGAAIVPGPVVCLAFPIRHPRPMTVSVYAFAAMMLLVGLSVLVWLWRGDRPTAGFGNRQLFMTRGSSIKPTDAAKQHAKPQTALAVVGALTLLACWATYRRGRGGR